MAKNITIDDLARMVKKGFDATANKTEMNNGFKEVNKRLDNIEKLILSDHKKRIEKLELQMHEIREALVVK